MTPLWVKGDSVSVNIAGLFSSTRFDKYWNYSGSLTSPPCTQGVKWTIIKDVQPISDDQLTKFSSMWADNADFASGNGNNRATQNINDRELFYAGAMSNITIAATSFLSLAIYLTF